MLLDAALLKANMKAADLARAVGVERQSITNLKSKATGAGGDLLQRVIQQLDLSTDEKVEILYAWIVDRRRTGKIKGSEIPKGFARFEAKIMPYVKQSAVPKIRRLVVEPVFPDLDL